MQHADIHSGPLAMLLALQWTSTLPQHPTGRGEHAHREGLQAVEKGLGPPPVLILSPLLEIFRKVALFFCRFLPTRRVRGS